MDIFFCLLLCYGFSTVFVQLFKTKFHLFILTIMLLHGLPVSPIRAIFSMAITGDCYTKFNKYNLDPEKSNNKLLCVRILFQNF